VRSVRIYMFQEYTTEKISCRRASSSLQPNTQMSGCEQDTREPIFYYALPVVMRAIASGLQNVIAAQILY
jgi:hypothetical protein